jgi:hypothetical protein
MTYTIKINESQRAYIERALVAFEKSNPEPNVDPTFGPLVRMFPMIHVFEVELESAIGETHVLTK